MKGKDIIRAVHQLFESLRFTPYQSLKPPLTFSLQPNLDFQVVGIGHIHFICLEILLSSSKCCLLKYFLPANSIILPYALCTFAS